MCHGVVLCIMHKVLEHIIRERFLPVGTLHLQRFLYIHVDQCRRFWKYKVNHAFISYPCNALLFIDRIRRISACQRIPVLSIIIVVKHVNNMTYANDINVFILIRPVLYIVYMYYIHELVTAQDNPRELVSLYVAYETQAIQSR